MSKIFISHSRADSEHALAISKWLDQEGWSGQYFINLKRDAIAPGERWELPLRAAARKCEVVILLISHSWLGSTWCLDEMRLSRHLGKRLIGVIIDQSVSLDDVPDILKREWQLCYLAAEAEKVSFLVNPDELSPTEVQLSSPGLDQLKLALSEQVSVQRGFPGRRNRICIDHPIWV